jgi:apolipoprotein N-acyltransferase
MRSLFGNLHTPSSLSPLTGQPPGRTARGGGLFWSLVCVFGGALQAASLAWPWAGWHPPGLSPGEPSGWLQIGSLCLLVFALRHAHRVGQAFWRGWVFATLWLAGSLWWLFVSMHTYGGLAAWMAVLAVAALAGALALFYAVASALLCAWAPRPRWLQALMFAALWTLAELVRGRWLTGLPWGAGGYAQADLMAAWAPWVGVYGMGAIAALLAYALALAVSGLTHRVSELVLPPVSRLGAAPESRYAVSAWSRLGTALSVASVAALLLSVVLSDRWHDTGLRKTADAGPLSVWLLQGNIPQNEKFETGTGVAAALSWYPAQIAEAARAKAAGSGPDLVVAPETAVPVLPQQLGPEFWEPLFGVIESSSAAGTQGLGVMVGIPLGSMQSGYTNSAWGLSAAMLQGREAGFPGERFYRYSKHHLVPFGEFIPPLFRWFTDLMRIPLGDFARGEEVQPGWVWAGQRVAPNICYEDLFGEELAASFRDPAVAPTVLVNLSNIGWFGDTIAIDQHLQISRLRALELGRPMLRATNTGATAALDHRGVVTHRLPRMTRDRLEATVQGRTGLTPYATWAARWGQGPVWLICLAVVALALGVRKAGARRPVRARGAEARPAP